MAPSILVVVRLGALVWSVLALGGVFGEAYGQAGRGSAPQLLDQTEAAARAAGELVGAGQADVRSAIVDAGAGAGRAALAEWSKVRGLPVERLRSARISGAGGAGARSGVEYVVVSAFEGTEALGTSGGQWLAVAVQTVDAHSGQGIGPVRGADQAAEELGLLLMDSTVLQRKGRDVVAHTISSGHVSLESVRLKDALPRELGPASLRLWSEGGELLAKGADGQLQGLPLETLRSAIGAGNATTKATAKGHVKRASRELKHAWAERRAEFWAQARAAVTDRVNGLLLAVPPLPPWAAAALAGRELSLPRLNAEGGALTQEMRGRMPVRPSVPAFPTVPTGVATNAESTLRGLPNSGVVAGMRSAASSSAPVAPSQAPASPGTADALGRVVPPAQWLSGDQQKASTWYFGYGAGLRFQPGSVTAVSGHRMEQLEGSAALCDSTGALRFYSDGLRAFDAQHRVIAGGSELSSDVSATQAALFVPVPDRPDQVLLFTVDQGGYRGQSRGLRASRLALDLRTEAARIDHWARDIRVEPQMTEKLAAVHHRDGQSVWVLGHRAGSDAFVAYRVTAEGVVAAPVVSAVGAVHPNYSNGTIGQMKLSPDGRWLAVAVMGQHVVEVFGFDNATGMVGPRVWGMSGADSLHVAEPYGVEFSPSGRFLFVSSLRRNGVVRFDLAAGGDPFKRTHQWQWGSDRSQVTGALQLGPDGRVYAALAQGPAGAGSSYVGVVDAPEGPWRYRPQGVALVEGTRTGLGLPSVVASQLGRGMVQFTAEGGCVGDSLRLRNTSRGKELFVRWEWQLGDGRRLSSIDARVVYAQPGTYEVMLTGVRADGSKSSARERVQVGQLAALDLGPDQTLPADGSALQLGPSAAAPGVQYRWNTGAETAQIAVQSAGAYELVARSGGCVRRDTVRVFPRPLGLRAGSNATTKSAPDASTDPEATAGTAPVEVPSLAARLAEHVLSADARRWLRPFEPFMSLAVWYGPDGSALSAYSSEGLSPFAATFPSITRPMLVGGLRYRLAR